MHGSSASGQVLLYLQLFNHAFQHVKLGDALLLFFLFLLSANILPMWMSVIYKGEIRPVPEELIRVLEGEIDI